LSVSPLEADKSFSIVAVKMPQTAHYKRQNKFMQIAAVAAAEQQKQQLEQQQQQQFKKSDHIDIARDRDFKPSSERWQLTLRRALSINHFNRNLCVVDVVNTSRHDSSSNSSTAAKQQQQQQSQLQKNQRSSSSNIKQQQQHQATAATPSSSQESTTTTAVKPILGKHR